MSRDLTVEWDGKKYRVPETEMFELIESIERHITLPELLAMIGSGKPNFSALARPFHTMLTHAGVRNVPPLIELRRMLVKEGFENLGAKSRGEKPKSQSAMDAIGAMINILMDGADIPEVDEEEKKSKPRSRKAVTKSRSGNGA